MFGYVRTERREKRERERELKGKRMRNGNECLRDKEPYHIHILFKVWDIRKGELFWKERERETEGENKRKGAEREKERWGCKGTEKGEKSGGRWSERESKNVRKQAVSFWSQEFLGRKNSEKRILEKTDREYMCMSERGRQREREREDEKSRKNWVAKLK